MRKRDIRAARKAKQNLTKNPGPPTADMTRLFDKLARERRERERQRHA